MDSSKRFTHQCCSMRANTHYTLAATYYKLTKRQSSLHSLIVTQKLNKIKQKSSVRCSQESTNKSSWICCRTASWLISKQLYNKQGMRNFECHWTPDVRESYFKATLFRHSETAPKLESKQCSLKHTFSAYARETTVCITMSNKPMRSSETFDTPSVPFFK